MPFKRTLLAICLTALACSLSAQHPELSQIQSVYLLPMGNGFDQYLANQLTKQGPYRVVTDPQAAEAIFTDRLGETFETKFKELFPPPAPEPIPEEKDKEKDKDSEEKETTAKKADTNERFVPPSSFSRGKGTIFLVERKSRRVVWSTFDKPKFTSPEDLNATAERVVKLLRKDLGMIK